MQHHELDPVVLIDRGMAGVDTRTAGATGQGKEGYKQGDEFHDDGSTLQTIMQQCNVLPETQSAKAGHLNKMEQMPSARLDSVAAGIFCPVQRLIGSFEH